MSRWHKNNSDVDKVIGRVCMESRTVKIEKRNLRRDSTVEVQEKDS
jgi:hypothetical protein